MALCNIDDDNILHLGVEIDDINYSKYDVERDIDPDKYLCSQPNCHYYTEEQFKRGVNMKHAFSVIHLNSRSLWSNFSKIKDYLNLFPKFSVVAVSETWLDEDKLAEVELEGYQMFVMNRKDRRGGGVALYVDSSLQCNIMASRSITIENILECVTVEIRMEKQKNIIVCCIYRTPGSSLGIFNEFVGNMFNSNGNKTNIVCGDFNVDLLNPGGHKKTTEFINAFYNSTLFPVIAKPTRITTVSATLIDNIFSNDVGKIDGGILITDISDHLPVFACFQNVFKPPLGPTIFSRTVRHRTSEAIETLQMELNKCNWDEIYSYENPNEAYSIFLERLLEIYNKCCPFKTITYKCNMQKPWFTKGIIKSCKKKNLLYRKFIHSRTQDAESKYKTYKNKLVNIIRNSKKDYYTKLLIQHRQNIQGTWKVLNDLIHKKYSNTDSVNYFNKDNYTIRRTEEIVNEFSDYFVNIGNNLAKKIVPIPNNGMEIGVTYESPNSFFFKPN